MEVLSPVGVPAATGGREDVRQGDASRSGTIALLDNGWPFLNVLYDEMQQRLSSEHGYRVRIDNVPVSAAAPTELLDELSHTAECVIVGSAT